MPVTVEELNKSTSIDFPALASKEGLTPQKLIKELKIIAFSDIANHIEVAEGGELQFKTFKDQGQRRRAIKSMKEKTVITESKDGERIFKTSTVDFTMYDKLEAIQTGMGLHGMKASEKRDVNLSGGVTLHVVYD